MQTLPNAQPSEPYLLDTIGKLVGRWNQIGSQAQFYARVIVAVPLATTRYRSELLRLIAQMALGTGKLAVIGGAVGVFGFVMVAQGILTAVLSYNELTSIGVDALTGLTGALINLRFLLPATCGVLAVATIGAASTAELGAMRINEEIDALEVIGVRSEAFLASTRLIAGMVTMVPLFSTTSIVIFVATRIANTVFQSQPSGNYDHYFNTFFTASQLGWAFVMALAITSVAMLIHTYYGYTAHGGPAGVGEAVGQSVRNALMMTAVAMLVLSLGIYGQSGEFHLAD